MKRFSLALFAILCLAIGLLALRGYFLYKSTKILIILLANSSSPKEISLVADCPSGRELAFVKGFAVCKLNASSIKIRNKIDNTNFVIVDEKVYLSSGKMIAADSNTVISVKKYNTSYHGECKPYASIILK